MLAVAFPAECEIPLCFYGIRDEIIDKEKQYNLVCVILTTSVRKVFLFLQFKTQLCFFETTLGQLTSVAFNDTRRLEQ